jgi:hypothetical protein
MLIPSKRSTYYTSKIKMRKIGIKKAPFFFSFQSSFPNYERFSVDPVKIPKIVHTDISSIDIILAL